jgi:hypothetical protein
MSIEDKKELMIRANENQRQVLLWLSDWESRKLLIGILEFELSSLKSTINQIKKSDIKERYNIKVDEIMQKEIKNLLALIDLLK